jgi:hypothetical protein
MAIRYIVRPSHIRLTPKALATKLEAEKVVQTSLLAQLFDPSQDVFLGYPPPNRVQGFTEGQAATSAGAQSYRDLYSFYCKDKYSQRKAIDAAGIKVPVTWGISPDGAFATRGGKFVIRPRNHMGGQGFQVVDNVSAFTSPNTSYLSRLFERQHEYRVIYSHGQRVCTLYKKMPEGISQDVPWTLANGAFFQQINSRQENHRLHDRGAYAALEAFSVVKEAHVCAVDIAVSADSYAVFEINFCPSLKLESRLEAVANRLKAFRA